MLSFEAHEDQIFKMKALLKALQRSFSWQACVLKAFNKENTVSQLDAKNRAELLLSKSIMIPGFQLGERLVAFKCHSHDVP